MNSQHQIKLESFLLEKKFDQAQEYLDKIKPDLASSTYYYNLGVLYHKMGKLPYARWAFEKSFYEGGASLESWHNWNVLASQSGVDHIESSFHHPFFYNSYLRGIGGLFLVVCLIAIYKRATKKTFISCAIASFFGTVILWAVFSGSPAIVVENTEIKEGPSVLLEKTGELSKGTRVVVGKESEGWVFLRFPLALSGWVNKKSMLQVK